MAKKIYIHPDDAIILNICFVRGQKILLDSDLAKLYGVETKVLNQAVKRNSDHFPLDSMFQLTENEVESYISEQVPQDTASEKESLRSQIVTSNVVRGEAKDSKLENKRIDVGRGGARKFPYAFTEQGIAMLSSVLNSSTAISINIQIIRIFVKMREMLSTHIELQQRIENIEKTIGVTNREVQDLYSLFIQLVENHDEYTERKIGYNTA